MKIEENVLKKLSTRFNSVDRFFIQQTAAIIVCGLIFAFSSSTYESYRITNSFWSLGLKQLTTMSVGLIFLLLTWFTNYKTFFKYSNALAFTSLGLMVITVFTGLGKTIGGSQRWLDLGPIQFQPAELAKLAVIILISKQLSLHKWSDKNSYFYIFISFLLIATVFKQPDLGTTLILLFLIAELLFLYEWPLWLLSIISIFAGVVCYVKVLHTPYQLDRLKFWLSPHLDPLGKGYNLIQANYALGFGGLFGTGLGHSIQKQGNLPVPHSDFIFAIIAEEVGFIGVAAILLLYFGWVIRGLYLMSNIKDSFGRILGTGIILLICTQACINISVAIGLFPITGVTLPFFSCGGTSLLITLAMIGILFNIQTINSKNSTNK